MAKSKVQKEKRAKHLKIPKGTVYPYLYRSVSFVLASMFLFAPLMFIGFDKAKSTVADAQSYLKRGYYDLSVSEPQSNASGEAFVDEISLGTHIADIKCERVGLNEKLYYGYNRVTLRDGAGLDSKSYLFGRGGCSRIAGNSSTSFGSLYDVKAGDVIVIESRLGNYEYKVYEASTSKSPIKTDGDALVLATQRSNDAFTALSDESFYVYATLVDKEVQ